MRTTALARLALGGLLLGRPDLAPRLTRTPATRAAVALSRLLGVRYLAQGALDLGVPHDRRIDAAVDALHAASMLPVAYLQRRYARLALLSSGVALALAVADGTGRSEPNPSQGVIR